MTGALRPRESLIRRRSRSAMTHSEDRWPSGRKRAVRQIIRVNRLDHGPRAGGGLQNSGAIHRRMKGRATAGEDEMSRPGNEIGRASCRERVSIWVVADAW